MRRVFLQVHLVVGLLTGLYIVVVSLTGVLLVWRIDLQRLSYPELFTPTRPDAIVDAETVLASVRAAYPLHRVSGVDAPTTSRPTYLAYVTRGNDFVTILADPATGRVLGELPDAGAIRLLQDVHFNLLGGRRGRLANGVGAAALLTMCATGLVIWWPSPRQWARAFVVDARRPWRIVIRDLHGAAGIWTVVFLAMWALTGAAFAFPSAFRSLVGSLSPLTTARPPVSGSPRGRSALSWGDLIARAQRQLPDQHVARVVIGSRDVDPFLVMFSSSATRAAGANLTSIYLDRYSGDVLPDTTNAQHTAGDIVLAWTAPLHVGNFAGTATKIAWTLVALAPTVLFVTGLGMWATKDTKVFLIVLRALRVLRG
jgi:uncharacterized iron-regulated membrane protein